MNVFRKFDEIIVDMHNCYFRMVAGYPLKTINHKNKKIVVSGIEGSLRALGRLESQFLKKGGRMWLLFDNSNSLPKLRKDIDPTYKNHRESISNEMKVGIRYLIEMLKVYKDNYRVVFCDKMEADDLVKPVINYVGKTKDILLISNDMDWSKSMTPNILWYNWKKLYTNDIFKIDYKFSPEDNNVQLYKSFKGDKSDNIPNPFYNKDRDINWKLPEKYLNIILTNCDDINDFFNKLRKNCLGIDEKWTQRFKYVESRLRLNYSLVDFCIEDDFDIESVIVKSKYSKPKLRLWFDMFELDYEMRMVDVEDPDDFFGWASYKKI